VQVSIDLWILSTNDGVDYSSRLGLSQGLNLDSPDQHLSTGLEVRIDRPVLCRLSMITPRTYELGRKGSYIIIDYVDRTS
jgi:hypothetical protein